MLCVEETSLWCWKGEPFPPALLASLPDDLFDPTHFSRKIIPELRAAGVRDEEIDRLLIDNPRRFFEGEKLATLA